MPVSATPASPDVSLLSFIANPQAMVMLFSNGTVQVSDQNQHSTLRSITPRGCILCPQPKLLKPGPRSGSQTADLAALGNPVSLGTV